jgi:hypothetical protein
MGKRRDAQIFLKNIEEDPRLSFCRNYDDCNPCGFYSSKKGMCKLSKDIAVDQKRVKQVKNYLEGWLATHPKKLPYNMFKKIMVKFDVEDIWTQEQNIAWINEQVREFGYEVKE